MANENQEPRDYIITAEIQVAVRETSIPKAYKSFTDYMAKLFERDGQIVRSYEGIAIDWIKE